MNPFARKALVTCVTLAAPLNPALAEPPSPSGQAMPGRVATSQAATDQSTPDVGGASGGSAAKPRKSRHAGDRNTTGGSLAVKGASVKGSGPTVLGDSIGVGLSMASGAPRLAREGTAIRSSAALAQIRRVPGRSVVVLSLGTNDAVGSIRGVEGAIDRIVEVADRNDLKVIWLGPPCVLKTWNSTAERLDAILKARLHDDGNVRYVSAVGRDVCDRSLRAGDGVHFTMKGYAMLWSRVVAAKDAWTKDGRTGRAEAAAPPVAVLTTKVSGRAAWNDL